MVLKNRVLMPNLHKIRERNDGTMRCFYKTDGKYFDLVLLVVLDQVVDKATTAVCVLSTFVWSGRFSLRREFVLRRAAFPSSVA